MRNIEKTKIDPQDGLIAVGVNMHKSTEVYAAYHSELNNLKILYYWCPVKLFCVPKIKVGFLAWNPTFFVTFVFVTKPK